VPAAVLATALAVAAQSFAPVAHVNDGVVTTWELQQRQRMLAVLNAAPEVQAASLETLINEKIQLQAADSLDIVVSDAAVLAGIDEFAARGNLSGEEFPTRIGGEGIAEETVQAFIRAGLAWREAVRARFEPEVQISPDEVARELETVGAEVGPRVLLSEIVLPARNEIEEVDSEILAEQIRQMRSFDAFSNAAREYSTADSAENGGRIEWIPLVDLQGPVANALQGLSPGQVSQPVTVPDGIALFQLRGMEEGPRAAGQVQMDYAMFLIPGGRTEATLTEAARIEALVDTCNDLYSVAKGLLPGRLIRELQPASQIPSDIRAQLEGLDMNEVSTSLTRSGALVFLMLCERNVAGELAIEETAITARLRNQELVGLAGIWLAELKSEAYIRIGE
jgi:peptidyl-prolyl cis-trans isomerase SurA